MIVYFLRHGLAGKKENWQGEDALRPLTEAGIRQMHRIAQNIAGFNLALDAMITSPMTRAAQTAEIAAQALGMQDKLQTDARLEEGRGLEGLAGVLRDNAEARVLMVVGHKEDFGGGLTGIVGGGYISVGKGGLARVDMISIDPPMGKLVWLIPPEILER